MLAMLSGARLALLVGAVLLPATAAVAHAAGVAHEPPAEATRTVLAQAVDPAGSRGRTLALSRVTIPAHTRLGLHRHPGSQIAYIPSGTLTYTVRKGVVNVYRGAGDQEPTVVRRVAAGRTGTVRAGEWVIEGPRVVHFGANEGDRPVLILLATLFRNGAPASVPMPG
jgi:quercetin dioxygenase-like cupin family protein